VLVFWEATIFFLYVGIKLSNLSDVCELSIIANVNNSVQRHVGRKHIPSTNNGSRGSQKHERKILMIDNSHFRPIKTNDFLKDCYNQHVRTSAVIWCYILTFCYSP
jgi:hypothetical protein